MKIAFFGDSLTQGTPGASYYALLAELLPDDDLYNFGRGGDAVQQAYERISATEPSKQFDLAFLWIGTNDVLMKLSTSMSILRLLRGQNRVRGIVRFARIYQAALQALRARAGQVITVSPWFVGEDVTNQWNQELDELSAVVEELSAKFEDVRFIDLRAIFRQKLASKPTSDYYPAGLYGIGRDLMTLTGEDQVNRAAAERGLHYTLDGTHLNGRGAEIIATIFAEAVNTAYRKTAVSC